MKQLRRKIRVNRLRDKDILPTGFIWVIGIHVAFVFAAATIVIATTS